MVQLNNFDANTVEPQGEFKPIPNGEYQAIIEGDEQRDTKAGTGQYLMVKFQIVEGEMKGRKIVAFLNLWNPNAQAVSIAQSELSSICRAVGVMSPQDTSELHNKPLIIKTQLKPGRDDQMQANIVAYKPIGTPAPLAGNSPPWQQ